MHTTIGVCVCACKQVISFLCYIKVTSLSAPQKKQRAEGSLGRSALPWATYQTAWMSVEVCVCVRVCLQRARDAAGIVGGC